MTETVTPGVDSRGKVYCPNHLCEMTAYAYRLLGPPDRNALVTYLWWKCPKGCLSPSLPLPDSLTPSIGAATVGAVRHDGADRVQPPHVAEPPSGTLRR